MCLKVSVKYLSLILSLSIWARSYVSVARSFLSPQKLHGTSCALLSLPWLTASYAALCSAVDGMATQAAHTRALLQLPDLPFVVHEDDDTRSERGESRHYEPVALRFLVSLTCGHLA